MQHGGTRAMGAEGFRHFFSDRPGESFASPRFARPSIRKILHTFLKESLRTLGPSSIANNMLSLYDEMVWPNFVFQTRIMQEPRRRQPHVFPEYSQIRFGRQQPTIIVGNPEAQSEIPQNKLERTSTQMRTGKKGSKMVLTRGLFGSS